MYFTPRFNSAYVAYFAPYPYQRHQEMVSSLQEKSSVHVEVLGQTLDGRDVDLIRIGVLASVKGLCIESRVACQICQ